MSRVQVLYLSDEGRTGESQLVELRNMRVLSEEAAGRAPGKTGEGRRIHPVD